MGEIRGTALAGLGGGHTDVVSQGTWLGGICGQGLSPKAGLPPRTHPLGKGQQKAREG